MIRTTHAPFHIAAVTHPGTAGRPNEDRFAVSSNQVSQADPTQSVFAIISDGIGGHKAGEMAAEMAVEDISHMVAQSDARQPLQILDNAIQVTSEAIAFKAKDDSQRLGMGTTCACAWVIGNRLYTASVGDSRIYLLRNGGLTQLTVDHTWVQEAMDKGLLKPQDAHKHPNVHVIRRYLGSPKTPQADIRMRLAKGESDTQSRSNQGLRLLPGDLLLLCTDGLTDVVEDAEIEPAVHGLELQAAVQALVDLACSHAGKDNITVVMMLIPWQELQTKKDVPLKIIIKKKKKRRPWLWVLIGLGLVLLALAVAGAAWAIFRFPIPHFFIPSPTP
jgi:serine/threonine protein phosphatase PrpC